MKLTKLKLFLAIFVICFQVNGVENPQENDIYTIFAHGPILQKIVGYLDFCSYEKLFFTCRFLKNKNRLYNSLYHLEKIKSFKNNPYYKKHCQQNEDAGINKDLAQLFKDLPTEYLYFQNFYYQLADDHLKLKHYPSYYKYLIMAGLLGHSKAQKKIGGLFLTYTSATTDSERERFIHFEQGLCQHVEIPGFINDILFKNHTWINDEYLELFRLANNSHLLLTKLVAIDKQEMLDIMATKDFKEHFDTEKKQSLIKQLKLAMGDHWDEFSQFSLPFYKDMRSTCSQLFPQIDKFISLKMVGPTALISYQQASKMVDFNDKYFQIPHIYNSMNAFNKDKNSTFAQCCERLFLEHTQIDNRYLLDLTNFFKKYPEINPILKVVLLVDLIKWVYVWLYDNINQLLSLMREENDVLLEKNKQYYLGFMEKIKQVFYELNLIEFEKLIYLNLGQKFTLNNMNKSRSAASDEGKCLLDKSKIQWVKYCEYLFSSNAKLIPSQINQDTELSSFYLLKKYLLTQKSKEYSLCKPVMATSGTFDIFERDSVISKNRNIIAKKIIELRRKKWKQTKKTISKKNQDEMNMFIYDEYSLIFYLLDQYIISYNDKKKEDSTSVIYFMLKIRNNQFIEFCENIIQNDKNDLHISLGNIEKKNINAKINNLIEQLKTNTQIDKKIMLFELKFFSLRVSDTYFCKEKVMELKEEFFQLLSEITTNVKQNKFLYNSILHPTLCLYDKFLTLSFWDAILCNDGEKLKEVELLTLSQGGIPKNSYHYMNLTMAISHLQKKGHFEGYVLEQEE